MKRRLGYLLPFIIAAALALGIFIGGKLNFRTSSGKLFTSNSKKDKLNRLIDYIDYEYVDEVDTDSIVDVAVNNILSKLDPHSVYIPKQDLEREAEKMKGDFVGIGVSFYMYKDSLAVIRPILGGPSMKKGILPGDRILMANKDTLFGKNLGSEGIVKRLKGVKNSNIDLTIYRKGTGREFNVTLERNEIPIPSVDAYYMLNDAMGYIKINRFAESTYREFKKALDFLLEKGASQLTLDLRDNPGGYLGIAEQIADEFLADEKLILFTKDKKGHIEESFATAKGDFEDGEIFVLINEQSASASEIVAGALQDNDKGTIVGRRSFGKGLVQREMELGDGSAIRLTVSRYYTPTGRSIQKSYKKGVKDYYQQFRERWTSGELSSLDSIKVADSLKFKTAKGKVVYGGGGIIPDVFVPINSQTEEAIEVLERSGFLSFYIFEHLDEDRNRYQHLSRKEFLEEFRVDDIMFENFIDYCMDRGLEFDFYSYSDKIKKYLKASIAEQIYDVNTYEKLINEDDTMLKKVLELGALTSLKEK